jgi:hypothetical protein
MNRARVFIAFGLLLACVAIGTAQSKQYPNELEGYEFFGKGKLNELKLGSSKKADVEKTFGHSCEETCDYNDEFSMVVHYVSELNHCLRTKNYPDRKMCPRTDIVGTIFGISLSPKRYRGFQHPSPLIFTVRGGGMPIPDERGIVTSFTSFDDSFSLGYSTVSVQNVGSHDPEEIKVKLLSNYYTVTDDFISEAFTVAYATRKQELGQ